MQLIFGTERRLRLRRMGGRHGRLYLAKVTDPIAHRRAAAAAGSARIPLYWIVLSGSRRGVAQSATRVRARHGLWRHRRGDFGFGRFGHAAEWRGDCAGVGVQPLGQFRSTQRVLSNRFIARAARCRLFHSHSDRSAVAHNVRIDVSCVTAEPARASGGGVERAAAPATRRATDRARTGHVPFRQRTSDIQWWSPPAVCCTCSHRLLAHRVISLPRSISVAFGAKRTCGSLDYAHSFSDVVERQQPLITAAGRFD